MEIPQIEREVKTYVRFYSPGTLLAETTIITVDYFDPQTIDIPDGVYAFQSYKIEHLKTIVNGEVFTKSGEPFDQSPMYYPGGQLLTLADIQAEYGEDSIMYLNVEGNGYKLAVRCITGNCQFFSHEHDVILPG
jgi:hypothetical protein